MAPVRVAIVGATGYTGAELLRILLQHPHVSLTALAAREKLAPRVSAVLPSFTGLCDLPIEAFDADVIASRADVAFCALPHGASVACVAALAAKGLKVFDLSADFRLRSPELYASWYGAAHAAPALLETAVYGLPELHRAAIRDAKVVAVPGCYPTASTLPLLPLLADGIIAPEGIVIHALSGVSGGGRAPGAAFHFPEAAEGARNYKIAGTHRHTPEIEQVLGDVLGHAPRVTFTPTLAPMTRGILSTQYAMLARELPLDAIVARARDYYAGSPSVVVLDPGVLPDTLWVRGSNRAMLGYALDARTGRVISMGAIDNLVKGAAGQAVQCMNVACGFDEGTALQGSAVFP